MYQRLKTHGRLAFVPILLSFLLSPVQAEDLRLGDVVEQALQRHPELGLSQSRQAVAERQMERSESLLAGDTAVQLRYKDDGLGSDNGLSEWGAGVEMPIWLPGQKASYRRLADSLSAEASAARQLLAWQESVRRDSVADLIHDLAVEGHATLDVQLEFNHPDSPASSSVDY